MSTPTVQISMFAVHWSYAKERRRYTLEDGSTTWLHFKYEPETKMFNVVVWQWSFFFGFVYETRTNKEMQQKENEISNSK